MKYKLSVIFLILIMSGCLTLPKQIDEVYLSEITEDESAKLDKIGEEIISKKRDKDKAEFDLEIIKQRIEVTKKEIAGFEINNELIVEKEKLYTLTGENSKLMELSDQTKENRAKITRTKAYLKYSDVKKTETENLVEVRKSELAVTVAELDYEKAMVAKKYQLKRAEEFEDDMIDELEYKKFVDDQKVKLTDMDKKYEESKKNTEKAMEELKKTGYEVK